MKDVLESGKQAILAEARALESAAGRLGETFVQAVELIHSTCGKVITTGLGKSGHIARKVASTLSSTGTSAVFLHPSEALHGDLGMIGKEDCLLAIAYGGETREVIEVARYARRNNTSVVVITGKPESTLAKLGTIILDGSVQREVCPLNLAPTASSTLALAMGDALAVALMHRRGFREQDFARFHPEGSLGRKLSLVKDLMRDRKASPWVRENASLQDVLDGLMEYNFGLVGVISSEGSLLGVVTDGDVRRALKQFGADAFKKSVADLMTASPKSITETSLVLDAIQIMEKHSITVLVVLESERNKTPVGLIKLHDLIAAKAL